MFIWWNKLNESLKSTHLLSMGSNVMWVQYRNLEDRTGVTSVQRHDYNVVSQVIRTCDDNGSSQALQRDGATVQEELKWAWSLFPVTLVEEIWNFVPLTFSFDIWGHYNKKMKLRLKSVIAIFCYWKINGKLTNSITITLLLYLVRLTIWILLSDNCLSLIQSQM